MLYYGTPYLLPTYHIDSNLVLAPYFWEDGHSHSMNKEICFQMVDFNTPGLKILNYHPIDIYFNTYNIEHRNKIKDITSSINSLTKSVTKKFINNRVYGVRDHFVEFSKYITNKKYRTILCNDLNKASRENIKWEK